MLSVTTDKAVEDLNKIVGFLEQEPTHAQAIAFNLAAHMTNVKEQLTNTIRGIERKKRTAASHVLFFLISDEKRARKLYAVPVQYVSYATITDNKIRQLSNNLKTEMVKLGMQVIGSFAI